MADKLTVSRIDCPEIFESETNCNRQGLCTGIAVLFIV